jgi:hypothetical protein
MAHVLQGRADPGQPQVGFSSAVCTTSRRIFVDYAALVSEWLAENPLVTAGRQQLR